MNKFKTKSPNTTLANSAKREVHVSVEPQFVALYDKWVAKGAQVPATFQEYLESRTFILDKTIRQRNMFAPVLVNLGEGRTICFSCLGYLRINSDLVLATLSEGDECDAMAQHIDETTKLMAECSHNGRLEVFFG